VRRIADRTRRQKCDRSVIATGVGNCHVYVDASANLEMAVDIADNAKNSRPSVCNAAETLLVHEAVAGDFLPKFKKKADAHHTKLMLCEKSFKILGSLENTARATEEDWSTEYLDYILSVKVVRDVEKLSRISINIPRIIQKRSLRKL
jgi:glutamate-5-semialdehyde dehydrogenase